jgi:hypothetical protein
MGWGAFRGIGLIYNIVDGIQLLWFDEIILRESGGFRELRDIILTSLWRICRRGAKMRGLDGSIGLNNVARHLNLSVLPAHARKFFTWKDLKKWSSGQIHRIFLLFYHVSIAGISNHHEALLTRFRFDVYSPRYLHEQKVSDFRGSR